MTVVVDRSRSISVCSSLEQHDVSPSWGRSLSFLPRLYELQVSAYEQRLQLQPNGADALKRFNLIRSDPGQLCMQQQMGNEMLCDWISQGQDFLKFARIFAKSIGDKRIERSEQIENGYQCGVLVNDGSSTLAYKVHPLLLSNLDDFHFNSWKRAKESVGLPLESLTQQSISMIDPSATAERHLGPLSERAPLLSNCNRIGMITQMMIFAKLSEREFQEIFKLAVPGNPQGLPLTFSCCKSANLPITTELYW